MSMSVCARGGDGGVGAIRSGHRDDVRAGGGGGGRDRNGDGEE